MGGPLPSPGVSKSQVTGQGGVRTDKPLGESLPSPFCLLATSQSLHQRRRAGEQTGVFPSASSLHPPHPGLGPPQDPAVETYSTAKAPNYLLPRPSTPSPHQAAAVETLLQIFSSQRSHTTAPSILNGHAPRISFPHPVSHPSWGSPPYPPPIRNTPQSQPPGTHRRQGRGWWQHSESTVGVVL
jgi:hypothetical protein